MNLLTALDTALHGRLAFDMNHLRFFRITEQPVKPQGATIHLTVKGRTGKYRMGGDSVTLHPPEDCYVEMPSGDGVLIMPYDSASMGYSFFKGRIDLRVISQQIEVRNLIQRIHDLYLESTKVHNIDELHEQLRVFAENARAIKMPSANDFPQNVGGRYSGLTAGDALRERMGNL